MELHDGGAHYDTQGLETVLKAQCLLATEMNGNSLTDVYGEPLYLRVESPVGAEMVECQQVISTKGKAR